MLNIRDDRPSHTSALPASCPECPLVEVYTALQTLSSSSRWRRPYPKDHGFLQFQLPRPGDEMWALNTYVLGEIQDSPGHLQHDSHPRAFPKESLPQNLPHQAAVRNHLRTGTTAPLPDSTTSPLHHPLLDGSLRHICGRPVACQL